jgi:hypothetical protein
MKRNIFFIEAPNSLSLSQLSNINGGTDACTDYSGSCLDFDECKDKFTGSCSVLYDINNRLLDS